MIRAARGVGRDCVERVIRRPRRVAEEVPLVDESAGLGVANDEQILHVIQRGRQPLPCGFKLREHRRGRRRRCFRRHIDVLQLFLLEKGIKACVQYRCAQ